MRERCGKRKQKGVAEKKKETQGERVERKHKGGAAKENTREERGRQKKTQERGQKKTQGRGQKKTQGRGRGGQKKTQGPMISHHPFHMFFCSLSFASASGIISLSFGKSSSFPLSESSNIHRIISVFSSFRHLTQLGRNVPSCFSVENKLLLSTFDTYPTVTVGVDSVARVLQGEALPTPPS